MAEAPAGVERGAGDRERSVVQELIDNLVERGLDLNCLRNAG
jgi:hypothetical protein